MTPDESRYGYDELRWLAQDTQKRRRRAMWWTSGLVLGAMTLATVYVSREQPNNPITDDRQPSLTVNLGDVPASLKDINKNLVGIREALEAQQPVSLSFNAGGAQGTSKSVAPAETNYYVNRVVWLVEGSRRFPMAQGDVLWIPEADRWLKLDSIGTEPDAGKTTMVEVWGRNSAPPGTTRGLPISLPATLNTANCVTISSDGPSRRAAFTGYVDIEVLFSNLEPSQCR